MQNKFWNQQSSVIKIQQWKYIKYIKPNFKASKTFKIVLNKTEDIVITTTNGTVHLEVQCTATLRQQYQ